MRDIKFRAWDTTFRDMNDVKVLDFALGVIVLEDGPRDLTHLILMQYTGLKDKNGKEIYEGDIVKFEKYIEGPKHRGLVRYDNELCGFFYQQDEDSQTVTVIGKYENPEVIGNIYENPELLK